MFLATGWTVLGSNPLGEWFFSSFLSTKQTYYTIGTGSFPGVKMPGRGLNTSPLLKAEVKEKVKLYFYTPFPPCLHGSLWGEENDMESAKRAELPWDMEPSVCFTTKLYSVHETGRKFLFLTQLAFFASIVYVGDLQQDDVDPSWHLYCRVGVDVFTVKVKVPHKLNKAGRISKNK